MISLLVNELSRVLDRDWCELLPNFAGTIVYVHGENMAALHHLILPTSRRPRVPAPELTTSSRLGQQTAHPHVDITHHPPPQPQCPPPPHLSTRTSSAHQLHPHPLPPPITSLSALANARVQAVEAEAKTSMPHPPTRQVGCNVPRPRTPCTGVLAWEETGW